MVVAAFSVVDRANQVKFFEKTFLVTNVSPEVVFGIFFLALKSVDVDFSGWELWWKTYITKKALSTTRCVDFMGKKEFAAAVFDSKHGTYVVHVAFLSSTLFIAFLDVHLFRRPQISGLITEETLTKVSAKYSDFVDVFSLDLASELPKHSKINNHDIELVNGCQQPPYGPIYSLEPIELETLKAYIETNLAKEFIRPSKSTTEAFILFEQKSDDSFRLCVDYQGLNNLTIKNRYSLPPIRESLDRLGKIKRFTQLDLTIAYH